MDESDRVYEIREILEFLPHRYPFILVDRVTALAEGESIAAFKNVTMNEPFFQGHFPTEPIMPGVLIIEGLAQAAAILAYAGEKEKFAGKLVYFAGIDGVRFRRKVVPGDRLVYKIEIVRKKIRIYKFVGRAYVDGKLACEAELMATFA